VRRRCAAWGGDVRRATRRGAPPCAESRSGERSLEESGDSEDKDGR